MKIKRKPFGVLASGKTVDLYVLEAGDLSLSVSTFGGTLVSLMVPSASGAVDDVLLGFSAFNRYTETHPYFGVTVGRYANRIAKGRFKLDGAEYELPVNNGLNTLHGGPRGFDKRVWKADAYNEKSCVFITLCLDSPDGEQGFPGAVQTTVTYGLTDDNQLFADYRAKVDAPCPINLTNHAYFNLKGEGSGDILAHELILHSASYVPVDANLIPVGKIAAVEGGPFDFRQRKAIGADIAKVKGGYDHCYVVDGAYGELRPCAQVFEPESGRSLAVMTTQPGVQFYSGNFLDGVAGKLGSTYGKHAGFCLETQHFPDSPNQKSFPNCVFGPERKYHEQATFSFAW